MKKENKIYKYLSEYFYNMIDKNKGLGNKCDSYSAIASELYDEGKINLEECDLINDNMSDLIDFVLFVVSECPEVQIHIDMNDKSDF